MTYVEAPEFRGGCPFPGIFLAGGITNCPDWQSVMRDALDRRLSGPATLFNPRRRQYPSDPDSVRAQINWEFIHLWKAQIVTFWFAKATLCPITLYELGSHLTRASLLQAADPKRPRICIGIEDGYQRTQDIVIQRDLLTPKVPIVTSIEGLTEFVIREAGNLQTA